MSGIKGMKKTITKETCRQKMWQTIRIKRRGFNIPDLVMTVSGATMGNANKFTQRLAAHGIIAQQGCYVGGRPGEYKGYRLRHDAGPKMPGICPFCKKSLSQPGCVEK